jgi:hypothetical protein
MLYHFLCVYELLFLQKKRSETSLVRSAKAIAGAKVPLPPAKLLLLVASAVPTARASGNAVR